MMKTDLERFIELYKSFGVDLKPKERDTGGSEVTLEAEGKDSKLDGYM